MTEEHPTEHCSFCDASSSLSESTEGIFKQQGSGLCICFRCIDACFIEMTKIRNLRRDNAKKSNK